MEFQGKKKQTRLCFSFVTSLSILGYLCAATKEMHYDSRPAIVEEVHVGVILHMESREGKIVHSCITTALSDFYQMHNNYTTRVILHTRNSKAKPLHALSAALNLLDDVQVQAIIGAQTSMEANLLAELGEEAKVPVMSLSQPSPSPSPSNKYPFFVEITQDETSQIMGISALIEKFEWRDVILIYEDTKYGRDIIPSLVISLQEKNVYISHKISFATSSRSEQIIEELQKLMQLNTKVFLVHISHLFAPCLFLNAKRLGMMREGYAWIMTSSSMNFLHSMDLSLIESMQGVVGLKSRIPASRSLHNLTSRLRTKFYMEEANVEVRELSADAIWAYDATWALAEAIERARIVNSTTNQPYTELDLPDDINNTRSSRHGVLLLREILEGRFKGLSGKTRYPNGKRNSGAFEIVNVIGKGERTVGLLPCVEGNIKESHLLHSKRKLISTGDLETIIWPGGSTTVLKGSKSQLSEVKLRIGVPVKVGFKELVRVDHDLQGNRTYVTGFCIDVFKAAIGALPYKVHYEFIPFQDANGHSAGTYNDLVHQVYLKKYDAVVGDTTITSNRSLYVDFTVPYTDLGVGMIVPNEKENMWIFLKPLSADLWITSLCFFVVTGLVVWLIERPINQEFQGSPSQQIGTIFWFSFSTLVFAHREKLSNNLAKFVVIVWLFVVLILNSSYTATLASMMTVKQIQFNSKVNSIGYQIGTFTKGPIDLNFKGLKQFIHSEEEYADALSRGSKHGGASAIIDEIPYIKIFLAKYSAKYSMIKTKSTTNGFAFVFPKGSKLVHDISRQIETLREEGKLLEMEESWFQSKTTLMYEDKSNPNTLNLNSFRGLFLVTGVSSASALFLFKVFSLKVGDMIRGQQQRIRMFFLNMAFQ